jgi:hypothetical protein
MATVEERQKLKDDNGRAAKIKPGITAGLR